MEWESLADSTSLALQLWNILIPRQINSLEASFYKLVFFQYSSTFYLKENNFAGELPIEHVTQME